ncbi:MAG TPA: hypothetical protein DEP72_03675 [Clostridiales bacterium]|nr:MAG: hypothetical protein A2Y18_00845 [Clostridiales bacterium GWD2_32_19]HCC07253.1 hypothetical protein [Clostridiales bacterium]
MIFTNDKSDILYKSEVAEIREKYSSVFSLFPDEFKNYIDKKFFVNEKTFYIYRETLYHTLDVSKIIGRFAKHLGYLENEVKNFMIAGFLHDIGKLTVDPNLLMPCKFDIYDHLSMEQHTIGSTEILKEIMPLLGDDVDQNLIRDFAMFHHILKKDDKRDCYLESKGKFIEWYVKDTYNLVKLPETVEMITIVDIFHAMMSNRGYNSKAFSKEETFDELSKTVPGDLLNSFKDMCRDDEDFYTTHEEITGNQVYNENANRVLSRISEDKNQINLN